MSPSVTSQKEGILNGLLKHTFRGKKNTKQIVALKSLSDRFLYNNSTSALLDASLVPSHFWVF